MKIEKYYYGYDEFLQDTNALCSQIQKSNFEAIVAVARGGVTLGHFLASKLDNRNLYTINSISYNDTTQLDTVDVFNIPDLSSFKSVVLVDDIVDSGKTIKQIISVLNQNFPQLQIKIASIFYKKTAIVLPHFYIKEAHQWIDFFWEVD
jgi:xanthine phosphoribosyltransferase